MITHDTLTMPVLEGSGYEAKFNRLISNLQQDPLTMQAFLAEPASRLAACGIPVARSLADSDFGSLAPETGDDGNEPWLEMKFNWWGVDFVVDAGLIRFIRKKISKEGYFERILSGRTCKNPRDVQMEAGVLRDLKAVLYLSSRYTLLPAKSMHVHWRVSWVQWATGLPLDLLLHFSSCRSAGE